MNDVRGLSGPYVLTATFDTQIGNPTIRVTTVDGMNVVTVPTWGSLFGSLMITATAGSDAAGSLQINVDDVSGAIPPRTYALPAGTGACTLNGAWGDTVEVSCAGAERVFDMNTGQLLGSLTGVVPLGLGDGYGVVRQGFDSACGISLPTTCTRSLAWTLLLTTASATWPARMVPI
jgi:hypothetical protein